MYYKNKKSLLNKRAFTLIELLIVIAIIGILFIVLVSKVDFATDKAKAAGVQTDFRSFQVAFDTVAKENAGFNTFGWDTGDANQNGKRDSYDEGDNGAGGGTAKNGIQDGDEVFTGHKVYDETFTKVFSLKKNGTGSYDREALNRLETAINANLDPKLHITIKDDGEIVMANGARDPWHKEYHGWYITNAETDGQDRGAIVMYSDGANNEFGSEHDIANGIVKIIVPGNNKAGKDDMSIVSCYTYVNGYGEVLNMTTGFSNNQSFLSGNTNRGNIVSDLEDNITPSKIAGLYHGEDFTSWDDLLDNGILQIYNGVLLTGPNFDWEYNPEELSGELVLPHDNSITSIGDHAFYYCTKLTSILIPDSVTSIGSSAFEGCYKLLDIQMGNGVKSIGACAFRYCGVKTLVISDSVTNISTNAFEDTYMDSITFGSGVQTVGSWLFSGGMIPQLIFYNGTMEEWYLINWIDWEYELSSGNSYQREIVCLNGNISIGN